MGNGKEERLVPFSAEELSVIRESIYTDLNSVHVGNTNCRKIQDCPADHFDFNDPSGATLLQGIVNKIDSLVTHTS